MIYADTAVEMNRRHKAFLRKWRLKCRAVADSPEEAGARRFAVTRLDPSQWKSARTTNAIELLNAEFRRRIKAQTVLLWALLASGQIQMRKVDGWETGSQARASIGCCITFYNYQSPHTAHVGQLPAVVYFKITETDQQVHAVAHITRKPL